MQNFVIFASLNYARGGLERGGKAVVVGLQTAEHLVGDNKNLINT